MLVSYRFECFIISLNCFIKLFRISDNLFELANSSKLFLFLLFSYWVSSFLVLFV